MTVGVRPSIAYSSENGKLFVFRLTAERILPSHPPPTAAQVTNRGGSWRMCSVKAFLSTHLATVPHAAGRMRFPAVPRESYASRVESRSRVCACVDEGQVVSPSSVMLAKNRKIFVWTSSWKMKGIKQSNITATPQQSHVLQ